MQNAWHKLTHCWPHNWLDLRGLSWIFLCAFYVAFFVGLYSLWQLIATFFMAGTPLAKRLFTAACLQAVLLGLGALVVYRVLNTLHQLTHTLKK